MKRVSGIMMILVFTAFFAIQGFTQAPVVAKAQAEKQKTNLQQYPACGKFVDKNSNGICDNYEARGNNGHGRNFTDKNGDGKCDNCQSACQGKGNGNCCGKGNGNAGAGNGCCGKGQGYQHRHGCSNMNQGNSKTTPDNQEKK
jgi:hypothetical protein